MEISTIDAAYAAGFFDGEGYVDIYKATMQKAGKSPSLMLRVIISQKDGRPMNWLQERFGGHVLTGRKDIYSIYRWDIRGKGAKDFLTTILPFSILKKDQIILALEFEESKKGYLDSLKGHQGFRQLSEDEINNRLAMKNRLKELKKVYPPYRKN